MIKNIIIFWIFLLPILGFAQVGIGTTEPQRALHVAGETSTIRIESLNAANNPENNGVDLAPVYVNKRGDFTLTRTEDGFAPITIINANTTFTTPVWVVNPKNDFNTVETIYTYTFTLPSPASLEVKYSLSYFVYEKFASNGITPVKLKENKSRQIMNYFTVNADPHRHGQISQNYYNDSDAGASGAFYNNGFGYISLPAGTHTLYFIADIGAWDDNETLVMFGGGESLLRLRFY